jgi:hypothetical protein
VAVASSATDWIAAGAALVQALAILIGGVWAYYEFVRGRRFASRAEVRVDGKLLAAEGTRGIRVAATLHNPGETRIPIRAPSVTAQTVPRASWGRAFEWQEVGLSPIFNEHAWIEARETITDEALIPLPESDEAFDGDLLAYRVECVVYERRTDGTGGLRWSAAAIVPGRLRASEGVEQMSSERSGVE